MNEKHLQLCASDAWAELVARDMLPAVLQGVTLGDALLELGPGPGRTTDLLRTLVPQLTAVELDDRLAAALARRLQGTNVAVVHADATCMPFPDGRFSAVVSLTMLHHLPSPALQDALFAEAARVLRPGGVFAGIDSLDSEPFRELHVDDICVPLNPATLAERLRRAGFAQADVETLPSRVRFRASTSGGAGLRPR